jgi:hypothetical protein
MNQPSPGVPILAIAAPVKGEAAYLLEWIAYHRVLGIRAFLLADNGGTGDTSKLLQALHERKIILRFDWREHSRFQLQFYEQALAAARLFADGLFLIDVDEFLRPAEDRLVTDIAAQWLADPSIGAVALNWAVYGSSGRVEPGEGLVIERFTRRGPQEMAINNHVKTFARVKTLAGPGGNPHAVALGWGRYVDTRGEDVAWDTTRHATTGLTTKTIWDVLRVDHFPIKSRAEFAAKRARGTLGPPQDWDGYWIWHDRNDIEDPIPAYLVERTKAEMAKIVGELNRPSAPDGRCK